MAGGTFPARTLARPIGCARILAEVGRAGPVAGKALARRPVIFAWTAAEESTETEATARQMHGAVGIAIARRHRVADAGDEKVLDGDVRHHALCGAIGQRDVHARGRRPSVGDP